MPETHDLARRLDALGPGPDELDRLVRGAVARATEAGVVDVHWSEHDLPTGRVTLAATDRGLAGIWLRDGERLLDEVAERISPRIVRGDAHLDDARRQLDEYFAGRRTAFDLDLDWRLTTGYRRDVLQTLRTRVGYGHTASYGELARLTGRPKASRAVGTAMATNPIPIVVPCHRVLRTGGALGGYAGGLEMKRVLLRLEGSLG